MSETLIALVIFALANSMTPGPNNIMLTASGATFGYWRSMPHMLGIVFGFPVMTLAVGFGLGEIFRLYPPLHAILKWMGAAYLLYLAWRVMQAGDPAAGEAAKQPLSFTEAALFQWVNPKAWTMILSAIPAFTRPGSDFLPQILTITAVFAVIAIISCSVWCTFGVGIRRLIQDQAALRVVNLALAVTLALSVILLFV